MNVELCRAIVNQDNIGVCVIRSGKIIGTNSRIQELTGHAESDIYGEPPTALIGPGFQDVLDILNQGNLPDDSSDTHEISLTTASEGRIPVKLRVTEITYEEAPTLILRTEKPALLNSGAPREGEKLRMLLSG